MIIRKHTLQHRLLQWGQWTQEPRREFGRSSSPFGKIAEMHENAGLHGDGIRYEIIVVDGKSVQCPPDGGMWAECERAGRALSFDLKCREVEEAVACLPDAMRKAIIETYVVARKNDPRPQKEVAKRLKVSRSTVRDALKTAHGRIALRIYGPFQLVADEWVDEADEDEADPIDADPTKTIACAPA